MGILSFDAKLENEEEILDALLAAVSKNQIDSEIWQELHNAAVRDERVSELAFAYESIAQGRKLRTLLPAIQAELYYRAATFFGDVLGDEFGATTYLEKALGVFPAHAGAFERIDAQLTRTEDHKKLADLSITAAAHRPKPEQVILLSRAAALYENAGLEDKAIETYQQLVRMEPGDEGFRNLLEARYVKANRFRDVARMLEQALSAEPPDPLDAASIRAKLIDVFANHLKEPERAMPHVEALLAVDPTHPEARRVATRLLESKGLAARAAGALAPGAVTTDERARLYAIELENTRGPKRRDVLRRIGILKQDELSDFHGAFEAFEQALGIDPADDELRTRYIALGSELKGPLEVARTFARVSTVAKDTGVRSRITAEMGELLLRGGDAKRARTTLAGVLAAQTSDPGAILVAARALASVYEGENDVKNLADVLARIGELGVDETERQRANERVAQLASESGDVERAIGAWRRLVETPARDRALAALEPLYETRCEWLDLSFVLEQRAKDLPDRSMARQLSFRAADVLSTKTKDIASASEAWRTMIETYGPARDVYAKWMPILEGQRQWSDLAVALINDARLAPSEERAPIQARLGTVYLTRMRDTDGAIDAFRRALEGDPQEKTSRTTLEKLLVTGEHRLAAAAVLEPLYRAENDEQNLVRILDIKSQLSESVTDRLAALEEAAQVAVATSRDKALDFVGRGLAEAVEHDQDVPGWLGRFDAFAGEADGKRRASILAKALGDRTIDSPLLLTLAKRVGEEHAAAGDVAAALAALRRALAYDPSSTELIGRVDELLREQGNPEERVALYRAALEQNPDAARRQKLLHSIGAVERHELANPDAAIFAYKRALKDDADDITAFHALVELYSETHEWDELCKILEDRLPRAASKEEARAVRAQLAEVASGHGQPERAASNAHALLEDSELGAFELDLVERVANTLGDMDLLRALLERRVRESADPKQQVECLARLATLAERAGDSARAIVRLRQAAEIARGVGDDAEAVALLDRLRGIEPRDADATNQLVELHERAESWSKLPDLVGMLLDLTADPSDKVLLLRRLARTHADHLGNVALGFQAIRSAFALTPSDEGVLAEAEALAVRAESTADFANAIDMALAEHSELSPSTSLDLALAKARTLAADPSNAGNAAAAFRAVLEKAEGEPHLGAAAGGLEALLRAMPNGPERTADIRWLHGFRIERAKPEEQARLVFAAAVAEETELADPKAALALYRRVLELEQDDLEALSAVSRLSLAEGDVEGALAALIARRSVSEGEARNALDVQIAAILADRPGRAREALDRVAGVLEIAPHDPAALELAAKLLRDPQVGGHAAEVLEKSLDAVEDPERRVDILRRLLDHGEPGVDARLGQYERLFDLLAELGRDEESFQVVLDAARELPRHASLWDRAENTARQLSSPDPLAQLYHDVLQTNLPREEAVELGQRAVAFYEEWFEDGIRVVGILERLLEIEPTDTWAFDRLKLIFDAQERWDDLFALYDRAARDADRERRIELLEEAAQIAKDFANHSKRAIGYLEQLLDLKPGNARFEAALERLYERHGCHRELITLLGTRVTALPFEEGQKERARIAGLWLSELGDASSAIIVIEDLLAHQVDGNDLGIDVTDLLERVLAAAPKTAEVRESILPPPDGGRRDSYMPMAGKRGLVRQRAAALLKERYGVPGREADLARVLEVELEAVRSVKERIRRHHQIATIYGQLGDDERALEHFVQLVLLEPEVPAHRTELAAIAARIGRYDRLAEVLVSAADDCADGTLKVELLMHAGVVSAEKIGDRPRAIELFFRVLSVNPIADDAVLSACRNIEPLLETEGRKAERLDILERLAILEEQSDIRSHVLGEAARLATSLEEDDRAIWAWEGRLETTPNDPEALDGLVALFEKASKWRNLIDVLDRRSRLEGNSEGERRGDRVRVARIQSERLDAIDEAIASWRGIEQDFGDSEESTRALAALYRTTRHWNDLAELLAKAAERTPNLVEKADVLRELGDVQREQLEALPEAIASYEAALGHDPRSEGARTGLRALLKRPEYRPDVVRVLLVAYYAADDWRLVLDLTEHRLNCAKGAAEQIAILMEAARISETRADDNEAAFALVRRALLLDPGDETTLGELFRLAEATRNFRSLADALRECIDNAASNEPWVPSLRFKMGQVLEDSLEELRAALDAFVMVAHDSPSDLEVARATIRVAGRTQRWDAAAKALVEATRALDALDPNIVSAVEDAAAQASGWDAITVSVAALVNEGSGLSSSLARDLEATVAVWHRDRRGDPDAAESAYTRALAHDATNADLLADLARLQRRAKGRPLVESLLRLSETTGGDLDLLSEAADVAVASVGDRALSKSILERLLRLAIERWTNGTPEGVLAGSTNSPESYVDRAARELVRIHGDEGDHERVVSLLVEASALPWSVDTSRSLRHEAAQIAADKLAASDRATGIYLGLIEEDPHDDRAVSLLIAIYESGNRHHELLALKRRLVETARNEFERLGLRLEIAALEDSLEDVSRAIVTLQANLAESRRHDETVKRLATLFTRESKHEELEALFASQARLAEEAREGMMAADLHAQAADVAENKLGDVGRAIKHLRSVVDLEPRPSALDALARLSTTTRDFESAADYLDRLRDLALDSERAGVTLRLADALTAAGRKADAQARLESEVSRDPEADHVRMRLAEIYRRDQAWLSLAELLTDGAAHAPDKATRLSRLREAAELHRTKNGDPERAIPLLEQASDLTPDDNAIKLALADALGAANRFEEARGILRLLIDAFGGRRPKERAPVHYHLARLDLATGDRARALVELDAATRIDPANPAILRTLAELARDDGQFDRAERSYRALLTVLRRQEEPTEDAPVTRSEVMFELSRIAKRQGEPDRAKEILESALELGMENVVEARRLEAALRASEDHASLARALEARLARAGHSNGSLDASKLATLLERIPDAANVYADLGRLYEEHLGRADDALEMRLATLQLDPASNDAHDAARRLAAVLGKTQAYEDRVRSLTDGALGPEVASELLMRLARIAETERQDDREAASYYERALAIRSDDVDALTALDRVYEKLGDYAGQARVLGMRVALDAERGGTSAPALYRLAQLRFRSGDVDAACDAFEQAFDAEPDADRAEELLRGAADVHPTSNRVIELYERITRADGRERSLVDALVRKWSLPNASSDSMREAVEIAQNLADVPLAESLLRRWLEGASEDRDGRVFALTLLAQINETSGRIRDAVLLKREAAELAEPDEARRLLFEVASLAAGTLDDLHLSAAIYEQLHEGEPEDKEAWSPLLDVYRRMGDYEKLSALVAEVAAFVDDMEERSRLRLERVRIAMAKLGLSDEDAANELREIVDEDSTAVEAAILLGSILERTGREDDLAELLAKQLDAAKDRGDSEAVGSLSRRLGQLLEKRDRQAARDVYYTALDWDPNAREVLVALERLHEQENEPEARAEIMERRLALETGDDAEALALELSEIRRQAGEAEAAVRALEIGFKAAPQSRTLRDRLEALYREQLEYEKLAELYVLDARGRADASSKAARLRDAARVYREELADPERAAGVLREAREVEPDDFELLGDLVEVLIASGELRSADEELSTALARITPEHPTHLGLVGKRATVRSRLGDGEGALADYEEALAHGLYDVRGPLAELLGKLALSAAGRGDAASWRGHRLRVAELRREMGDIEEARNVLTELLKADSKDRATLRAIAYVDELEERWDSASATYRRLVGLEEGEELVIAALKLAETCEKADRLSDARGGLERARAAAPDNVLLRQRLAWLYDRLGALKELAELTLEEARAAGDVAPRFEGLMRAGQLFLEQAQDPAQTAQIGVSLAIAPLEEAHALRPSDLDCAALLSDAYVGAGRIDDSNDLLTRTIATFKGRRARELSALYHRLARIAEFQGDRNTELAHLSTALDMDAQNGNVASELAYLAMELGNWEVAQRALRAVTMLKAPAPLPRALAYQHLGEIARAQGDPKRAMMLLKRAIDDDPNLHSARTLLDALHAEG
ncbi:Exonuclease SbcC [Labilithrix luteola]|uniref:Exonuclease SbcC n=1 Tax=Labilithrix luteola TaxID=1391654 RepID=A0A0K1PX27_9BACT|nr:tetratricopeptide repeat protein [Labilithrix luteola]AKU97689.1 Exonuclease SbcC [Labilithrix luteola]